VQSLQMIAKSPVRCIEPDSVCRPRWLSLCEIRWACPTAENHTSTASGDQGLPAGVGVEPVGPQVQRQEVREWGDNFSHIQSCIKLARPPAASGRSGRTLERWGKTQGGPGTGRACEESRGHGRAGGGRPGRAHTPDTPPEVNGGRAAHWNGGGGPKEALGPAAPVKKAAATAVPVEEAPAAHTPLTRPLRSMEVAPHIGAVGEDPRRPLGPAAPVKKAAATAVQVEEAPAAHTPLTRPLRSMEVAPHIGAVGEDPRRPWDRPRR
jgi:hypothetical protein